MREQPVKPDVRCPRCGAPAVKADTYERDRFMRCTNSLTVCRVVYFTEVAALKRGARRR